MKKNLSNQDALYKMNYSFESEENIDLPEDPVDNQIQELKDDVLSALSNLEKIEVDDDEKK